MTGSMHRAGGGAPAHDPLNLPNDLPVPQDDGGARHLTGMRAPDVPLAATDGSSVNLARLSGRTVVYVNNTTGEKLLITGRPSVNW